MPNRQLDSEIDSQQLLGRTDLFASLTEAEVNTLAERVQEKRFNVGAHLVEKGGTGNSMFILVEGLLNVCTKAVSDGRSVLADDLEPGDFSVKCAF
jgi:CRP-like cAMP-binding protein